MLWWLTEVRTFVTTVFSADPAAWSASFLLLLTLLFGIFLEFFSRKRTYITFGPKPQGDGFWIIVTNTSRNRNIQITEYGLKTWQGDIIKENHFAVIVNETIKPEEQTELPFYNREKGTHMVIDRSDVYYAFVEDSTRRTYRKYAHPKLVSWLKRFCWWAFR